MTSIRSLMEPSKTLVPLKLVGVLPDTLSVDWSLEPRFHLYISVGEAGTEVDYAERAGALFWRLESLPGSFVSVEIGRRWGQLLMFSVIVYTRPVVREPDDGAEDIPTSLGVPVFDRSQWPHVLEESEPGERTVADFRNYALAVRLELGKDSLRVRLLDDPIAERIVTAGTLHCELNAARELCAVRLLGFGREAWAEVEPYLELED